MLRETVSSSTVNTYSEIGVNLTCEKFKREAYTGLDFHLLFFKLGEEFRQNVREYHKQVLQKEADAESRRRLLQKNRQQEWERKQISEFSQEDVDSALRKLATKAPGSNRDNFLDKINLQGFQCVMTPVQFKIQLQRSFGKMSSL